MNFSFHRFGKISKEMPPMTFRSRGLANLMLSTTFLLFCLLQANTVSGQGAVYEGVNRLTHCLPPKQPLPPTNEQTLCQQFPTLTEATANKVIGVDQSSVSYSANEKDPNGPLGTLGWQNLTMVINGTLYINDPTWLFGCTVKMGPGAKIIVQANNYIFTFDSKFFACNQMWEGIKIEQNGSGSFWYSHIQDANNAIYSTKNSPISVVNTRFNRNFIGIYSANPSPVGGTLLPTTLVTGYFFDNEFTMTSALNASYSGQVFRNDLPTGIALRMSSANLPGLSNAPNTFSRLGYGIHATGFGSTVTVGNSIFVNQEVAGIWTRRCNLKITASNPCDFQDNYYAGIWTIQGTTNVSGCTFGAEDIQFYGITNEYSSGVISDNTFTLDDTHIAAIYSVRSSGDLNILNNTIDITSFSNGIVVETPVGVSAQGFCYIDNNPITINEFGQAENIGIYVIGGSGDNFSIMNNTLDIRPQGGMFYNIRGILFEQCTGMNHLVSNNTVFNTLDDKSAEQAISIRAVQNGIYCLNNTDDSFEGMLFFGNNFPADVERNYFDHHNYSFIVEGADFSPAVIGPQVRKANKWNPDGYKILAALCTGNPEFSRFFIHDPNTLYFPPSPFVSPATGWFLPDYGAPYDLDCTRSPEAPGDFETQVADGTYFTPNTTALTRWELRRNLYYKMLRNPNYGQGNPAFASFFSANANNSAGKFAKVERDLYLAGTMSASLLEDLEEIATNRDNLLQNLALLEFSQQTPSGPALVDTTFTNAKQALLEDLSELDENETVLLDQHFANVAAQLADIRIYNQNIPVTHTFEANQKAINEIGIKMALGEPLLESDLTTLENIADQPESTAGTTQWRAASMLPCKDGALLRSSGGNQRRVLADYVQKEGDNNISISPNPADTELRIQFQQSFSGTMILVDALGKVVHQVVADKQTTIRMETQGLPNGIYYLQVQGEDGLNPQNQKIVIAH